VIKMVLIVKDYSPEGNPLCHFCKQKTGIHAVNSKGNFVPACHSCYMELTAPVTRMEIKDIVKEAIKEYDANRND